MRTFILALAVLASAGSGGAQIAVPNQDTGRYNIVEGGPKHAVRTLAVVAVQDSHIDLTPSSKRQMRSKGQQVKFD
jgi:hypothetical protein